jgi:hypothetical protein
MNFTSALKEALAVDDAVLFLSGMIPVRPKLRLSYQDMEKSV